MRPNELIWSRSQNLLFTFNTQHDCRRESCTIDTTAGRELQEREETTRTVALVKHASDDHYIVNFDGLHNAHLLRRLFPSDLYQSMPLFQDRKQHHLEMAKKLRQTNTEKRELASSKRALTTSLRNGKKSGTNKGKTQAIRTSTPDTSVRSAMASTSIPITAAHHSASTQPVLAITTSTGGTIDSNWQPPQAMATTQSLPPAHRSFTPGLRQYAPQVPTYNPYHQEHAPFYRYPVAPHAYYSQMGNAHASGSSSRHPLPMHPQHQAARDATSEVVIPTQSNAYLHGSRDMWTEGRDRDTQGPSKRQRFMGSLLDS